ncbi:MAG TPA: hypothetical protein VGY30_00515 [Solirubrobacteraceae bacterium]|jgi:hypothetical protein|nr:hypothetical protein [Solirubrobacteraceae bacterium]
MGHTSGSEVLARYANWFKGDDDEFADCFVLGSGERVRLFQGLRAVTMQVDRADTRKHERLLALLRNGIPAAWKVSSYSGYNFVPDAEEPDAEEISVYGTQETNQGPVEGYFSVPPEAPVATLVKEIAKVD